MATLKSVTVLAPAKLNLALDVVGLLPNGYHNLDMTMQAITLYERVVLRRSNTLSLSLPGSPVDPADLVRHPCLKQGTSYNKHCHK